MEPSGEILARSALIRTTKVLALETERGCTASWWHDTGGGRNYSKIRIKMIFESK